MKKPLRLLFDECIGEPIVRGLADCLPELPDGVEIEHVLKYQRPGVPDAEWVPRIAEEGWIVITADRGKRGKSEAGGTLPMVCRRYGVTHVLLSAAVHRRRAIDKALAIAEVWDDLVQLRNAKPGSTFLLRLARSGRPTLVRLSTDPDHPSGETENDTNAP